MSAPLPGKLPEWPKLESAPTIHDLADWHSERAAYWESRARLAVKTLEDCARWLENDADQDMVQRIITQIGPLPEEDRT